MLMKPGASPHWGTNAFDAPAAICAHRARDLHVLGQIEVVRAALARRLGDCDVAVVGQARDDRVAGVARRCALERGRVARVERHGVQVRESRAP